ncbi:hypothetical protein HYPSUDRAFT_36095 [Hypholoma sublateritium FD-334 SS-4]|uniref:S15/NS1 RNA-binding domain-containing protein n=1 Tax=Hypholoma sublateritium (strain FD-334 SS-4) TaxID=945553 RepID=A0A0D2LH24_HYPSF|nr:hypothetical protein HYPSUDRAFT_36095 [Hypholoma sublateritium FD-334 SS-4]
MFRVCISSGSRALAQRPPAATATAPLHTSAVCHSVAKVRKANSLRARKANIAHTGARVAEAEAHRPSVILGTRPGDEAKWDRCDLARVLVDETALRSSTDMVPARLPIGTVALPPQFAYGVDAPERQLLFEALPNAATGMARSGVAHKAVQDGKSEDWAAVAAQEKVELLKANLLAKALDLRNANAAGIAFENRRRIIREFSTPENPFNPGLTEVQVALLTYRIRNLWTHLTTFKRDVGNRRALRQLVHQRAKLLKYLKGVSLARYDTILERLALEPDSVEGELVI